MSRHYKSRHPIVFGIVVLILSPYIAAALLLYMLAFIIAAVLDGLAELTR